MSLSLRTTWAFSVMAVLCVAGCSSKKPTPTNPEGGMPDAGFVCTSLESVGCIDNVFYSCEQVGEVGLRTVTRDCSTEELSCVTSLGCAVCEPDVTACHDGNISTCKGDGSGWDLIESCNATDGKVCYQAQCLDPCDAAEQQSSYFGCEFFTADLDNAAIAVGQDASAQQYAVVVSNPNKYPADVTVEINRAAYGETPDLVTVAELTLQPGDLEVFDLPRREVDGSSSNALCTMGGSECTGGETCVCAGPINNPLCQCRLSESSSGLDDGTHTALTSNAYRIRSNWPLVAYQFNPLDNVGVFSNDASLLLPTSVLGEEYTVVGWPQTIANDKYDPEKDFDDGITDEDLRAFLTIMGTKENTEVTVKFGDLVGKVVGGAGFSDKGPGDSVTVTLGPFDVLNLETEKFNADFTGTKITATKAVGVFVGSEASDAPIFDTYANRQCCADHLEEQLFPNSTLGQRFIIARMPRRTASLNDAFTSTDSVADINEPEWVRIVGTTDDPAEVTTNLDAPNDRFTLGNGEDVIIRADRDFIIQSKKPVAVLQIQASQGAVGIPSKYPGGDPSIVAVPPTEQYRKDYVFLTPDKYAFDFVTIIAKTNAKVLLDGVSVRDLGPDKNASGPVCVPAPSDGIERAAGDPQAAETTYRCQLSFPEVKVNGAVVDVKDGEQNDGVHTVISSSPAGITVFGFDAYVSYGYTGGLDLIPLN